MEGTQTGIAHLEGGGMLCPFYFSNAMALSTRLLFLGIYIVGCRINSCYIRMHVQSVVLQVDGVYSGMYWARGFAIYLMQGLGFGLVLWPEYFAAPAIQKKWKSSRGSPSFCSIFLPNFRSAWRKYQKTSVGVCAFFWESSRLTAKPGSQVGPPTGVLSCSPRMCEVLKK